MPQVKFGISQVKRPTPANVIIWIRVFTVAAGIFMGWMLTNNLISTHSQAIISSILGLLVALINGIAPLFGVQITTDVVPTQDVTSIKSDSSNEGLQPAGQ